jgi:hypothetical protein
MPGQDYLLQFFVSPEADDTGYGEGKTFIGSDTVTTDNSRGIPTFHLTYPVSLRDGLSGYGYMLPILPKATPLNSPMRWEGPRTSKHLMFNMPMHWVIPQGRHPVYFG